MNRGPGVPLDLPRTQDGRPILSRADLEAYDPLFKRSGGRDRFFCPVHGGDHQRSLSVEPDTGKYVCHAGVCSVRGVLREHWPASGGITQSATPAPSIMQIGQQALARRKHADEERAVRLAAEAPPAAATFLGRQEAMSAALRDPQCPGAIYLRRRGLDPLRAAELDAGYAEPNAWPGDRSRKVGRIVYPLADPLTGRIVSAAGRLCLDEDPGWTEKQVAAFREAKQRKLAGCPAGVWPYASISGARATGRPLVLVEGPADALTLLQRPDAPAPALALLGTTDVLPAAVVAELPGVVLALDDDAGGAKAMRAMRVDLALAGVRVEIPVAGWLQGAKDLGELATTVKRLTLAVHALAAVAAPLMWDFEHAVDLIAALYRRCGEACEGVPQPWPELDEEAIEAACEGRDLAALEAAIAAAEARFRAGRGT